MSRLEKAQAVLAALGKPAPRPAAAPPPPRKPKPSQFGQCTCGAQVIWTNLPSGARVPLDFNDASGDLCLQDGVAVEWTPALGTHRRRFSMHFSTCRERGGKQ